MGLDAEEKDEIQIEEKEESKNGEQLRSITYSVGEVTMRAYSSEHRVGVKNIKADLNRDMQPKQVLRTTGLAH